MQFPVYMEAFERLGTFKMQYEIEFLDGLSTIVRIMHANAESPATAFRLVVEKGWPPGALTARVFDQYGQLTILKPEAKSRSSGAERAE